MTTREVCALLGVSQQRVSQLKKAGLLVAEPDREGRIKYERASVEAYAAEMAERKERDTARAAQRRAQQEESRYQLERQRRAEAREREDRQRYEDEQRERMIAALEGISRGLQKCQKPLFPSGI